MLTCPTNEGKTLKETIEKFKTKCEQLEGEVIETKTTITTLNEYINTLTDVNKDAVKNWVNSDKSSSIKEYNHRNNDDDSEKEQTPRKCETCEMYIGDMTKEVTEEVIKDVFGLQHTEVVSKVNIMEKKTKTK